MKRLKYRPSPTETPIAMKYKLKFRVSGRTDSDAKNGKKYSVNAEEGQRFTLGKYIPGVDHAIASISIREGSVYASPKGSDSDWTVNDTQGAEFKLRVGDILKVSRYQIEFLEVPFRAEVKDNVTEFLDLAELRASGDSTRLTSFTPSPTAQPAPFNQKNPASTSTEVPIASQDSIPPQKSSSNTTFTTFVDTSSKRIDPPETPTLPRSAPTVEDPTPTQSLSHNAPPGLKIDQPRRVSHEITAMLPRAVEDTSADRYKFVVSVLILFLSSEIASAVSGIGSPLWGGLLGAGFLLMLAATLNASRNFTFSQGDFAQHLRVTAAWSFLGLIPWAYAYRFSPVLGLVGAALLGIGFLFGHVVYLRAQIHRAWPISAAISAIPALLVFILSPPTSRLGTDVATHREAPELKPRDDISPNQPTLTELTPQQPTGAGDIPQPTADLNGAPHRNLSSIEAPPAQPQQAQAQTQVAVPAAAPQQAPRMSHDVPDALAVEELFSAIQNGHIEIVRSLINTGAADPNFTLNRGTTPLMAAAQIGNEEAVKFLLSKKVYIDAKDPSGTTALMWAVLKDHYGVANLLIKKGANPEISRDNGQTAMDIAKRWNKRMMIVLLEEARMNRKIAEQKSKRPKRQ